MRTKGFVDVDASGQAELVRPISDARPDRSATHAGTRLFDFLREEPFARSTPRACHSKSSTIREIHSTASRPAAASRLDSGPPRASRSNCTGTLILRILIALD